MTLSLSSTYSLLKFRNTMWQKQAIYVLWERYLSAVKRHCDLRFLPCCVLFENTSGKYKLLHVVACRKSEWRGLKAKDLRLKQQFRDFRWSFKMMIEAKNSCSFKEVCIREREEMSIFHVHALCDKKHATTRFDINYFLQLLKTTMNSGWKTRGVNFFKHCTVTNNIKSFAYQLS